MYELSEPKIDNPQPSYRAENPTNPKISQKYQPDIQIPPTAGDRKNTPKIPQKYEFHIFLVFQGYLERYFGVSHVVYVGGYFCISWAFLLQSVAGRGVVKPERKARDIPPP